MRRCILGLTLLLFLNCAVSRRVRSRNKDQAESRDSNGNIVGQLKEAESSGSGAEPAALVDQTPKFASVTDELKWKLNKARRKLNVAKQYVQLAAKIAKTSKTGGSDHVSVKNIISKTEKVLVSAGEKLGLDYMHFKRSVSEDSGK